MKFIQPLLRPGAYILGGIAVILLLRGLWLLRTAEVVIEWKTGSELNALGFNLQRSPAGQESYQKINTALIPVTGDPQVGGAYRYIDAQATPGQAYIYELEEVQADGTVIILARQEVVARRGGLLELVLSGAFTLAALLLYDASTPRQARPGPDAPATPPQQDPAP
jgi:hypothetical protein